MRGSLRRARELSVFVGICLSLEAQATAMPPVAWGAPVEIAAGRGQRGEWRQNESDWDYVDDATIALRAHGAAAVAWVDQRRKDVFFQIYQPDGKARLHEPVNVSRTPAVFSWLPRIALAPDRPNDIYILWQEIVFSGGSHGGDIFFARSQDDGRSFGAPLNLSNSMGGDGKGRTTASEWDNGSLEIAAGADGTIYVAWTEYQGALWFSRSSDRGASFSKPLHVSGDDTAPARAPALAAGASGAVYVAWTTGEDARADIRVSMSDDAGRSFRAPTIAARTSDYSDAPKIALDGNGTLHLVYGERAERSWRRAEIHYTRSMDGGRAFSAPQIISRPEPPGPALAGFPQLSLDTRDNLYAIWEAYRDSRGGGKGLVFTMSGDGGRTFSAPAMVPGSVDPGGGVNGSNQGKLMRKLAINPTGGVAVVNSSLIRGEKSRVWLIRGELNAR